MNVRCCPNCEKTLLPGYGVRFDDENNVICRHCQKPIVATTPTTEHKITPKHKPDCVTYSAGVQKKTTVPRTGVSTPDDYHSHHNHGHSYGYGLPGQHRQHELAGHGFMDGYGGG